MTCDRVDPTGTSESMSRFSWSLLSSCPPLWQLQFNIAISVKAVMVLLI